MKKAFSVVIISALGLCVNAQVNELMPVPKELSAKHGQLKLGKDFIVQLDSNGQARVGPAVDRFVRRLSDRTGTGFKYRVNASGKKMLTVSIKENTILGPDMDESYQLKIDHTGMLLTANTDVGALRGLQTISQLLSTSYEGFYWPYLEIDDAPRFSWRGLLIDVCRHWQPVDVILRNLDAMEVVKMNVLHLHLTDDQGFRIESKVYPKLHEMGSNGNYYSQADITHIITYADARGIRVIPEFDMPGHTTSWFVGHPELASAKGPYHIQKNFGVFNPTMDPTREEVYETLDLFLKEMSELFPDEFIHIGGDENNGRQWAANEDIQKFMKKNKLKTTNELQGYFNQRIAEILTKHGKRMVGWDEVMQEGIPASVAIQSWRGSEGLFQAARKGHDAILSHGYYIDLCKNTAFHYLNAPIPNGSTITAEEKDHILGGEATMWSEMVTAETIDSRIWPRTAAIAERLWSADSINNVDDMYRRIPTISQRLEEAGSKHIINRELMMRRAANGGDITQLKRLFELVVPLAEYERHGQGKSYSTDFPFTRAADMAIPDPAKCREISYDVDEYLAGSREAGDRLITEFRSIQMLDMIKRQYNTAPALRELEPLSYRVYRLAEIGIEAIALIDHSGLEISEGWTEKATLVIEQGKAPQVECSIPWVEAIQLLTERATSR